MQIKPENFQVDDDFGFSVFIRRDLLYVFYLLDERLLILLGRLERISVDVAACCEFVRK